MPLPISPRSFTRIVAVIGSMILVSCSTVTEQDRRMLQERRVSGVLYDKMLHRRPLSLAEIVELSARNVPPAFIIRYVDDSLAVYQLTTEEVLRLRRAGVRPEVIDFLLTTPQRGPDPMFGYGSYWPYPYYRPVIIHHHHRHHH